MSALPPELRTSDEVATELGVNYRQLMRWVERGLITPYVADPRHKRAPRLWAPEHVERARRLAELSRLTWEEHAAETLRLQDLAEDQCEITMERAPLQGMSVEALLRAGR